MYEFTMGSKSVSVFPGAEPGAPVIYLNTYSNEGRQVFQAVQSAGCSSFTLVTIGNLDWNHDMAPWNNSPAFKSGESFTGGADNHLRLLVGEILPRAEKDLMGTPAWRGIVGYSLKASVQEHAGYSNVSPTSSVHSVS